MVAVSGKWLLLSLIVPSNCQLLFRVDFISVAVGRHVLDLSLCSLLGCRLTNTSEYLDRCDDIDDFPGSLERIIVNQKQQT